MKNSSYIFNVLITFFYARDSIRKGGVLLGTKKVSFRVEEGDLELLKLNIGTDNTSEAVKMAIQKCILDKDKGKVKTLFPYVGKKPPRIGREVVETYRQSGWDVFIDLFCGGLLMLCYLPWDAKVIVNDINGNLTNLYFSQIRIVIMSGISL